MRQITLPACTLGIAIHYVTFAERLLAGESSNVELQANAAGALQSICFQKDGRG